MKMCEMRIKRFWREWINKHKWNRKSSAIFCVLVFGVSVVSLAFLGERTVGLGFCYLTVLMAVELAFKTYKSVEQLVVHFISSELIAGFLVGSSYLMTHVVGGVSGLRSDGHHHYYFLMATSATIFGAFCLGAFHYWRSKGAVDLGP